MPGGEVADIARNMADPLAEFTIGASRYARQSGGAPRAWRPWPMFAELVVD